MATRAADIESLEQLLNNAGSFDELSNRAIEIDQRLDDDAKKLRWKQDFRAQFEHREQSEDFVRILELIAARRGDAALARYREYLKNKKKF